GGDDGDDEMDIEEDEDDDMDIEAVVYLIPDLLIYLTHVITSSCNGSPSCALVNEYLTSEFAEAVP
ncbi:hypothetical protein Tco_0334766, partial [Tanacetum coccineum]